jgi:hypothetical protein
LVRKHERKKINHFEESGIGERIILEFILIKGMGNVEWIYLIQGKDGWLACDKGKYIFFLVGVEFV